MEILFYNLIFLLLFSNSFIFFFEKIKTGFSCSGYLKVFFLTELLLIFYTNASNLFFLEILTLLLVTLIFLLVKKNIKFFFVNLNLLLIFNFLFLTKSFFNFLLLLEFLGFFIFIFLFFKNKQSFLKNNKVVFFFINYNLVSLFTFLLFFYNYFRVVRLSEFCYSYQIDAFFNLFYIKAAFTTFFFIKMGLISGPLFGVEIYKNLNGFLFNNYNLVYVVLIPFFFLKNFLFLFSNFFFFKVFLALILSNFFFLKKTYTFRSFLYYSSQINIVYLSFFLSIFNS